MQNCLQTVTQKLEKQIIISEFEQICPPTLVCHWYYEVQKFVSENFLSALQYFGLPAVREELQKQIKYHDLVIVSYELCRKDIDFFSKSE